MSNEVFLVFLIVGSVFALMVSFIVFSVFTESVRAAHNKLIDTDKKKQGN
jgi:divalent metal cation (Fe/Co/Zn/Cd) transporter